MNINIYDDVIVDLFKILPICIPKKVDGKKRDLLQFYSYLISEKYIPTIFIDSLFITFKECSEKIINWFNAFIQYYNINTAYEIPKPYRARTSFVIALIIAKHMLEYQTHAAPKEVQEIISQRAVLTWRGIDLTLDDVVGYIWPTTLNGSILGRIEQGIETVRLLKFNERIRGLKEAIDTGGKKAPGAVYKVFKILPSTLAFFNLISDSFSPRIFKALGEAVGMYRYKFIATGFGNYISRLFRTHIILYNILSVDTIAEIIKSLDATADAHMYLIDNLMESLRGNWVAVAKEAQRRFGEKASKNVEQYLSLDAELDTIAYFFILADSFLYLKEEQSDKSLEIRTVLSRYIWPNYLEEFQKTWEIFIKKFLANIVRI